LYGIFVTVESVINTLLSYYAIDCVHPELNIFRKLSVVHPEEVRDLVTKLYGHYHKTLHSQSTDSNSAKNHQYYAHGSKHSSFTYYLFGEDEHRSGNNNDSGSRYALLNGAEDGNTFSRSLLPKTIDDER
jgi:hypothetical protein